MEALLVSTAAVALAEIGDKTQLLAILLAARFRRPWPIVLGILVATLANHALAGALGGWLTVWLGPNSLRWLLGLSFLAMAAWVLVPDRTAQIDAKPAPAGVFGVTAMAFFIAEMGDKTQIATLVLAAQYQSFLLVVSGTTLGMMIANVPAVFVGQRLVQWVPVGVVRAAAAVLFAVLGIAALLGAGQRYGF